VRQAFFEIDPELPVDRVQPMTGLLERVLAQQRLAMGLLLVFSVLSVLLALVGLYGVLSVSVEQRRREIGIRMALGSQSAGVLRLVLLRGLSLTGAGLAAGLATAPLFTRVFQQMLYGVTPLDPLTFAAAGLLIAMAALLASLIPAWRAARVDPAVALRQE
jgi:putative ABC transport system permease protein